MIRVLDLFSGIGGFSYGLEKTGGFETVGFCEIDPYCRAIIARHWPGIPIFGDICQLTAAHVAHTTRHMRARAEAAWTERERTGPCSEPGTLAYAARNVLNGGWLAGASGGPEHPDRGVDLLCGGFPCQDLSLAGKGAGLAGARSGLWREYFRLICEFRDLDLARGHGRGPTVIVENVAALLSRGLGTVLADLASIGYDAEWHCIPASYLGAPHRRDRIWIVAYPGGDDVWEFKQRAPVGRLDFPHGWQAQSRDHGTEGLVAHSASGGQRADRWAPWEGGYLDERGAAVADPDSGRCKGEWVEEHREFTSAQWDLINGCNTRGPGDGSDVADASVQGLAPPEREALLREGWWEEGRAAEQCGAPPDVPDPDRGERYGGSLDEQVGRNSRPGEDEDPGDPSGVQWSSEPTMGELVNGVSGGLVRFNGRVASGVQDRVQKLRALGNAIVPQIAEMIGRAILNAGNRELDRADNQ